MGTTMKEEVAVLPGTGDGLAGLPAGFRFHPTDEEIITHYLREKIRNKGFSSRAIGEVDLNRCEPWDLPGKAKMGEKEWYFFCQRGMKYPTGTRTNRATESGYWKATGKDREIHSRERSFLVGMKKTLVFYTGRAPKGEKTNWVMHEYRLEGIWSQYNSPRPSKDDWVVCRVFHKNACPKKAGLEAPEPTTTTTDPFGMSLDFADDCLGKSPPLPSPAEYSPYCSSSRPCSSLVGGGDIAAASAPSAVLSPVVPPSMVEHQGRRKYFVSSGHLQPANLTEGYSMVYPQAPSSTPTYGSISAASSPNAYRNLHQDKAPDLLFYQTASDLRRGRPKVEQQHAYQSAMVGAPSTAGADGDDLFWDIKAHY